MLPALIDRSPDLRRLHEEGYELEARSGHLLVKRVPYLKRDQSIGVGTLVSTLRLAGDVTSSPDTHVATFAGDIPCDISGVPLKHIIGSATQELAPGLTIDHTFSSKPAGGFTDYYQKVTHYVALISGPAEFQDPSVTARQYAVMETLEEESPFMYIDNASARAGIATINAKLAGAKVAIVGVGGTGSYVLDFVSKTPVGRIDLYDADDFAQHNAFRAPGAASLDELRTRPSKAEYLRERYSKLKRNIYSHVQMIDGSNAEELREADVVFLCMDDGAPKQGIMSVLETLDILFIDVGMGIIATDGKLHGLLRVTSSTPQHRSYVHESHRIPLGEADADDYASNIQIAELNALNAALAVIKWKKLLGVYADLDKELHSVYTIDGNHLLNEDHASS
jgi:hypothetical protein